MVAPPEGRENDRRNKMGLKDVAAKKKPAAQKAKGIILEVSEEIEQEVTNWVENKRALTDAKANMEQAEGVILDVAQEKWQQACKANGSIETSAKIGSIRVSWKSKSQFVTATSVGDGERAKAVFGDEDYEKYFKEVDDYQITTEAANNPEVAARLEEVLGQLCEEFPGIDILAVKTKIVANDSLYNEWVMGNTEEVEQKFAAAGIKRTKPTFAQR